MSIRDRIPQLRGPRGGSEHIIRLDPAALFLIFFAVASFVAMIVLTNTPITLFGSTNDAGTLAVNYLLIGGAAAAFAPLLVGNYFYDPRELGPILRPVVIGKGMKKFTFPDVAIIGLFTILFGIIGVDYLVTYGGFTPTLSFWNTLTNRIAYADGGIFEEFIFRGVFFGTINRFPGLREVLLENPTIFLLVTAPGINGGFVLYHTRVYKDSAKALDMVFGEGYVITVGYRLLRYALWVVMVAHGLLNLAVAP